MSGWITNVTYKSGMRAEYDPNLPIKLRERVIHSPLRNDGGTLVHLDWEEIKSDISATGQALVICPMRIIRDPDLNPSGCNWWPGKIPKPPSTVDSPTPNIVYLDALSIKSEMLFNELIKPEFEVVCAKLRTMDTDVIMSSPMRYLFMASQELQKLNH